MGGVSLTPLSPGGAVPGRIATVRTAQDPYKRYWLVLLAGFGLTAFWIMLPMMQPGVGSVHVSPPSAATDASVEQNLERSGGGVSAPGGSLTAGSLSQQGAVGSMLYQAPEGSGASAAGAPLAGGAAAASLAQQLKDVGKAQDASGGGGEKAQRGFEMPHLSGGGLSGLSGGGGGSAPTAGVNSAFGAQNAKVDFVPGQGLSAAAAKGGDGAGQALRAAAAASSLAAAQRSGDAAVGGLANVFDGSAKRNAIGGAAGAAAGGAYAALDAAPANLKANNPDQFDKKDIGEPPPSAPPPEDQAAKQASQMKQAAMTVAMMGMAAAGVGAPVMMVMTMMMQQMAARDAEDRADAQQAAAANRLGSSGSMSSAQRATGGH